MHLPIRRVGVAILSASTLLLPAVAFAAQSRQIEEVVVTAERKESSVQDTSISITAFTADMLDDFGIRNQSDLQNMVPATTIQPYDSTVRGVGRNFRNLGGDPGVATYMNGVYSEDLYTATIGSFWDVDRIEVLRGPQGTLYGRNAVGGAMNFLYKKPTEEFDFSAKTIVGDYGTKDVYALVNFPMGDSLAARLVGSSRQHDGWVKEMSGMGPDLDSGDETNIALSVQWNITDNMTLNVRQNRADVDRVMGSASGAGLVWLSGDFPGATQATAGTERSTYPVGGMRAIDPTVNSLTDPLNPAAPWPGEVYTFTNPTTGATILAQRDRVGIDPSNYLQNPGQSITYGNECIFTDRENIKGGDLCAYTNGLNNETFEQQGTQLEFAWDLTDGMTLKYLFGYNDLLYQRTTDEDNFASTVFDRQFYVNHEAEYVSHELQLFWDVGDNLTFTSGVFSYDSTIDQRYDFYSSTNQSNISDPAYSSDNIIATLYALGAPLPPGLPTVPLSYYWAPAACGSACLNIDVYTAQNLAEATGATLGIATGPWLGNDSLGSIPHGPANTPASDLHALNKTERQAYAAYTQGVWNASDRVTLTVGVRWAEDEVKGSENLARYAEGMTVPDAFGLNLATLNILRGAISSTTLQPTGLVEPWKGGVPLTLGLYRKVERTDSKVTYRVNVDYDITDDMMLYGNVTTGYRSGGFNLAFFSETPQYEPEELIAYELGLKGQFLQNSLQLNASIYLYDYSSIHTFTTEACPTTPPAGGFTSACAVATNTSSVQAAPGAEVSGFEVEALWLATDNLTLGGNFSLTSSEYTESFLVTDGADPSVPSGVFTLQADRQRDIKGNTLLQVPDSKYTVYGSYNVPIANSGEVNFLVNYSWIDDVYYSAFESELDKAPAYARIDFRSTWTSPGTNWIVSAFVNNVTDDVGIRYIERSGSDQNYRRAGQTTEPRMYGLELTYNLNGR